MFLTLKKILGKIKQILTVTEENCRGSLRNRHTSGRLFEAELVYIAGLQLTSQQPCWMAETKRSPPLGTKLFYYANSAKTCFIVLSSNMAALSRGCKPRISCEFY